MTNETEQKPIDEAALQAAGDQFCAAVSVASLAFAKEVDKLGMRPSDTLITIVGTLNAIGETYMQRAVECIVVGSEAPEEPQS